MSALLLMLVVALPGVGTMCAAGPARRNAALASRIGVASSGSAALLTLGVAAVVFTSGPVRVGLLSGVELRFGLAADQASVILLLLITAVSTVVQSFAGRYLHADAAAGRFFAGAGILTAASCAMVAAGTLLGLAIAWSLAGAALVSLLRLYPGLPAAEDGARRTARAFLIGDGALWLAVVLATVTWGTLDLRALAGGADQLVAQDPTVAGIVACLIVIAALARSAQLPLQSWLPATLAAPTPVSALLHAGVVNAGGILLIKLSPLFGASRPAMYLAFVAGGATVVVGTSLMLVKPDVKGRLAHSTMSQMGFMVMTCGLGAYGAALFHLVAHGMFKASLFLGSGAAVTEQIQERRAVPRLTISAAQRRLLVAAAVFLPGGVLAASVALSSGGEGFDGAQALLLFAWVTSSAMAWGWLRTHPSLAGCAVVAGAVAVALPAYVAALWGVKHVTAPALVDAGVGTVSPWLLIAVAVPIAAIAALRTGASSVRLSRLQRATYVAALNLGTTGPIAARRPRAATPRPTPTWFVSSIESAGRS